MEPPRTAPPLEPSALPTPPAAPASRPPDTVKRFLAKFIDFLIASVLFWVVSALIPGWFAGAALGAVAAGAYLLVCDGLEVEFMRRRSLGKKLMGLDVVRLDGAPMDPQTSARRNWMFTLGYFGQALTAGAWGLASLLSLAGLAFLIFEIYKVVTDDEGRRWGDEQAGTQVIEA